MKEPISLTLHIDSVDDGTGILIRDLKNDSNIDTVEQTDTLAVGEAILIGVSIKLITELAKKTPQAVMKFKNFVRNILDQGKNISKNKQKSKITYIYRMAVIEVNSGSDEELDKLIQQVIKAHTSS